MSGLNSLQRMLEKSYKTVIQDVNIRSVFFLNTAAKLQKISTMVAKLEAR